MSSPFTAALADQRQTEMLEDAARQRLAREARASRPRRSRLATVLSRLVPVATPRTRPTPCPEAVLNGRL